jgi:hypothetical protein
LSGGELFRGKRHTVNNSIRQGGYIMGIIDSNYYGTYYVVQSSSQPSSSGGPPSGPHTSGINLRPSEAPVFNLKNEQSSSTESNSTSVAKTSAPPQKSCECDGKTHHHSDAPSTDTTGPSGTKSPTDSKTTTSGNDTPTTSSNGPTSTDSSSSTSTSIDTDAAHYRVFSSGDVTKHPPGTYPPASSDQIYEYDGSSWVLTSMSALPTQYSISPTKSMSDDDVYDSTGNLIAGDDYHPGYSVQIPDHAISKSPDRTFQPAPTGYHYRYYKENNTWSLEADSLAVATDKPWNPPSSGAHEIYVERPDHKGWAKVMSFTDGTPASQTDPYVPPSTSTTVTSSSSSSSTNASDTDTATLRVYHSGDVTKQPPGSSVAPSDQIYEYDGSSWVLTSMAAIESQYHLSPTMSMSPDDVYDSSGRIIAGDDYHPHYSAQIPDHAISKSPDRTFLPPPSNSHYAYDQAKHSWYLEADSVVMGTSVWAQTPSGIHAIYAFDSSNSSSHLINSYSDGTPAAD